MPEDDDLELAEVLDRTVADLLALALTAKHAHWNVVGPSFGTLHLLLDEVAAEASRGADQIAERSMALGRNPDGRPGTVAARNVLPALPVGPLQGTDAITAFGEILETVTTRLFASISAASCDRVTESRLIDLAARLEVLAWRIRAHGA